MAKILVLEDDPEISEAVTEKLQENLHIVDAVGTGDEAMDYVFRFAYDLALLDINVPGPSGLEVLKYIRNQSPPTKVILLTSLSSVEDKLTGFERGADDYLPKPFDMRELLARISAVVKRPAEVVDNLISNGDVTLNRNTYEVYKRGELVKVQPKDFALLEFLMRHPKETFSVEGLLDRVWAADSNASVEGLRVSISRLRKALDDPGTENSVILSINRVGYRIGRSE
jgi:DNA-binding response OmpR family regulator